jgi:SLOG cluster2
MSLDYKVDCVPDDIAADYATPPPGDSVLYRILLARCLTETRRKITDMIDACVVIGGKDSNYAGRYSGAVEESLFAIDEGKPLYLAGVLGGASRSIYDLMIDPAMTPPPRVLDESAQREGVENATFQDAYNTRFGADPRLRIDYQSLRNEFRRLTPGRLSDINMLSLEENESLATTKSLTESIRLVLKGLIGAISG